jgi:hypothetical protein
VTDEVLVEHDDGVVVITINRPHARNAVNRAVSYGVCTAVDELERRDDLRIGVLTGAGGTFCSGMDLKAFLAGEVTRVEGRGILGIAITPPKKPLIAAVEGYALAGGFEVVLACDLLVAARDAKFGLPEVKRGLAAAAGGLMRLPRFIPQRIAMEMALTGDMYSAEFLTPWPRQPARRTRRGSCRGAGARPQDHEERAARLGREQTRRHGATGLAARGNVRTASGDHRRRARFRGCSRGRGGIRREARSCLERAIASSTPLPR